MPRGEGEDRKWTRTIASPKKTPSAAPSLKENDKERRIYGLFGVRELQGKNTANHLNVGGSEFELKGKAGGVQTP